MPADLIIRSAHEVDFSAVLQLWQQAEVTPASNSDSIDGLTRLMDSAGAVLLVATAHGRIVGSVKGVSRALFAKGAERIGALVEHEHSWAVQFWESLGDLGYRRDPQFVRYIADRKND